MVSERSTFFPRTLALSVMKTVLAGFAVGVGAACLGGGILAVQRGGGGGWLFFLGIWLLLGTVGAFLLRRLAFPKELRLVRPDFRRLGRAAGVFAVALLLGQAAGYGAYAMLRGELLETAWTLPADSPAGLAPKGFWAAGDALVRVRSDGVAAYASKDGRPRWSHAFGGRQRVCGASRSADEGVGLVSSSSGGPGCDLVTALDLSTGRALWTAKADPRSPDDSAWESGSGFAAGTFRNGLKLFELRAGRPRHVLRPPSGCVFDAARSSVRISDGRLAATAFCKDGSARIVAASLGGRVLWTAQQATGGVAVLSAAPLVVQREKDGSSGRELLVLDERDGGVRATIPVGSPHEDVPVLVGGGRIHVPAAGTGGIRTYAPSGALLWSASFGGTLRTAHLDGSALLATYDSGFAAPTTLVSLDARSGAETRVATLDYPASGLGAPALRTAPGRVLLVLRDRANEGDPEIHAFVR